jgi:prophage regulatory protein
MSLEHSPARGGLRVLRRKEVLERLGVSNTSLWLWVRTGRFPAPIELGDRSRAWLEHEVDAWLLSRADARDRAAAHASAE